MKKFIYKSIHRALILTLITSFMFGPFGSSFVTAAITTAVSTSSISATTLSTSTSSVTNNDNAVAQTLNTLHVIMLVINENGGVAVASDFVVHAKNDNLDVLGSPAPGTSDPGTLYSLSADTYVVNANDKDLYHVESFSGACDSNGSVTLVGGENETCTIIATDIPVGGGGGGGDYYYGIMPLIGLLTVPSPFTLPVGSGLVTYNYTIWNVGGQQPLINVTLTDDKCDPVIFLSGDLNNNGKLDPSESWKYKCATTLSKTTTNISRATGYSDDAYHRSAIATMITTVVVGSSLPSPLINIIKIPSRLTPFPFGGGEVTYVYAVTNPGVPAMHNIAVTDDTCSQIYYTSGDINGNGLLDLSETWAYKCQTNVFVSTRSVARAEGIANGFMAVGYAFADVLVSAPGFPNTGFPPEVKITLWGFIALTCILTVSFLPYVIWKKRFYN